MNSELNISIPGKDNIILKKSFSFALNSIKTYSSLRKEKEYVISKQFLRSSTSIGANINESVSAVSKKDFAHKISIALKEARETKYWLLLLYESNLVSIDVSENLLQVEEIIKILTAISKTTKINS